MTHRSEWAKAFPVACLHVSIVPSDAIAFGLNSAARQDADKSRQFPATQSNYYSCELALELIKRVASGMQSPSVGTFAIRKLKLKLFVKTTIP
jgi:hypothetical protein